MLAVNINIVVGRPECTEESILNLVRFLVTGNLEVMTVMDNSTLPTAVAVWGSGLGDHMQQMSEKAFDLVWQGEFDHTFTEILEANKSRYRMASQTATHLAVAGGQSSAGLDRPAIELF